MEESQPAECQVVVKSCSCVRRIAWQDTDKPEGRIKEIKMEFILSANSLKHSAPVRGRHNKAQPWHHDVTLRNLGERLCLAGEVKSCRTQLTPVDRRKFKQVTYKVKFINKQILRIPTTPPSLQPN